MHFVCTKGENVQRNTFVFIVQSVLGDTICIGHIHNRFNITYLYIFINLNNGMEIRSRYNIYIGYLLKWEIIVETDIR